MADAVREQYGLLQVYQDAAARSAIRAYSMAYDGAISQGQAISRIRSVVEPMQYTLAFRGSVYGAAALAEDGDYVEPEAYVDPAGFVGLTASGRPLGDILSVPFDRARERARQGDKAGAKGHGSALMSLMVVTTLADTLRMAGAADIATRPKVGYVRELVLPSCSRCIALAGKFYKWNAGFLRHPRCDCVHRPVKANSWQEARAKGHGQDPYEIFADMDQDERERVFTKAGAQAIADGADLFQVVNARRGLKHWSSPNGRRFTFTTEGMGKRGFARSIGAGRRSMIARTRLTPETIYEIAGGDRERVLYLLEREGYLHAGGQNPAGAILGQRRGFGSASRGRATSQEMRDAIAKAEATGTRLAPTWDYERDGWKLDPRRKATASAAELRLMEAQRDLAMARKGINPASEYGIQLKGGPRIDPSGGLDKFKVTAADLARLEARYKAALAQVSGNLPRAATQMDILTATESTAIGSAE